jgi:hypothetical protein
MQELQTGQIIQVGDVYQQINSNDNRVTFQSPVVRVTPKFCYLESGSKYGRVYREGATAFGVTKFFRPLKTPSV